ncbi:MAG TPA: cupin domain-containing protein [Aggregicoccus sp.]|nr:cupin domain-containing protein [Aggregicoccus sp.]
MRVWAVDMAPGSQWPHVDFHEAGEEVYVVSGELIEGERRFGPGTYLSFAPGSSHQPRTESGVRLLGFNLVAASAPAGTRAP